MTTSIPVEILRDRAPLTIHQALAVYLCDDPEGPGLTHREAAVLLGLGSRGEIGVHLGRARQKQG